MMPVATFEQDIAVHIPIIQDLFASILETYCDDGDTGITAICNRFNIHRKLAWQIRNVAYSPDPFQAVRFMPTNAGMEALIAALNNLCVSENLIDKLHNAVQTYNNLVEVHAGDRTSMDMLVEACADITTEQIDIKWREKAYQGNSFIWGAQTKTQLSISILNFSANKPDWFDLLQVRGLINLKRIRPNINWLVGQSVILDDHVNAANMPKREPLDKQAAALMDGVPVLPELCSSPPPELRRRRTEQGFYNDELMPAPVGFTGQQTIVTGEVIRELAPIYATSQNKRALFGAIVRTPGEVFIFDHFVHKDLFPGVVRELCVFGELNSPVTQDDADLLPVSESIEPMGCGISVARTPEIPGYTDKLQIIFGKVGWNPQDFNLFRIRMAYPPMPSSVMIRHNLPAHA